MLLRDSRPLVSGSLSCTMQSMKWSHSPWKFFGPSVALRGSCSNSVRCSLPASSVTLCFWHSSATASATLWNFAVAMKGGYGSFAVSVQPNQSAPKPRCFLKQIAVFGHRHSRAGNCEFFGKRFDIGGRRQKGVAIRIQILRADVAKARAQRFKQSVCQIRLRCCRIAPKGNHVLPAK